jgi:hypothetical protein
MNEHKKRPMSHFSQMFAVLVLVDMTWQVYHAL